MENKEEVRQAAKNWREYLCEMRESFLVYKWVLKELIGAKCKPWAKKMLIALIISAILSKVQPWFLGMLFDNHRQRGKNFQRPA